jgi:uncharacterized protein (DUF305 family)
MLVMGCVLVPLNFTVSAQEPGARVIIPGRPGEPAVVTDAGKVKPPEGDAYTAADVWFVRMMIPHHAQALEMGALAPGRAGNPQIAAIAERMRAAQAPEMLTFRAWLAARRLSEQDGAHDHATMPGMQPPEAVRALAAASGAEFDRMFVAMMSAHHQGAIDMASVRLRSSGDVMVERMAEAVAFEQAVEIGRMRDILAT